MWLSTSSELQLARDRASAQQRRVHPFDGFTQHDGTAAVGGHEFLGGSW